MEKGKELISLEGHATLSLDAWRIIKQTSEQIVKDGLSNLTVSELNTILMERLAEEKIMQSKIENPWIDKEDAVNFCDCVLIKLRRINHW